VELSAWAAVHQLKIKYDMVFLDAFNMVSFSLEEHIVN